MKSTFAGVRNVCTDREKKDISISFNKVYIVHANTFTNFKFNYFNSWCDKKLWLSEFFAMIVYLNEQKIQFPKKVHRKAQLGRAKKKRIRAICFILKHAFVKYFTLVLHILKKSELGPELSLSLCTGSNFLMYLRKHWKMARCSGTCTFRLLVSAWPSQDLCGHLQSEPIASQPFGSRLESELKIDDICLPLTKNKWKRKREKEREIKESHREGEKKGNRI